jgi:Mn2+/Fe2+ NRAMP family transporter
LLIFSLVSAATFYNKPEIPEGIQEAYTMLESIFGKAAAIVFGIALLCAGQSST